MRKIYYSTTLALMFCFGVASAQEIAPTDLFQIYKLWQANDPQFAKNTYDFIGAMDKHWSLRAPLTKDDTGLSMYFGFYYGNNSWYKDNECNLMISFDRRQKTPKTIMYIFPDSSTWDRYIKQMELMEAVKLGDKPINGGKSSAYKVNDIGILLIEFPPGINGIDRTYEVQLSAI